MTTHIISREDRDRITLRIGADTHHESAEDWYGSYGAYVSTESAGDVTIQSIDYDWLDESDDDEVLRAHRDEIDTRITDNEALDLIARAREVREAADDIEGLLDAVVDAYERGVAAEVLSALDEARSAERDHGDYPATRELATRLLAEPHDFDPA